MEYYCGISWGWVKKIGWHNLKTGPTLPCTHPLCCSPGAPCFDSRPRCGMGLHDWGPQPSLHCPQPKCWAPAPAKNFRIAVVHVHPGNEWHVYQHIWPILLSTNVYKCHHSWMIWESKTYTILYMLLPCCWWTCPHKNKTIIATPPKYDRFSHFWAKLLAICNVFFPNLVAISQFLETEPRTSRRSSSWPSKPWKRWQGPGLQAAQIPCVFRLFSASMGKGFYMKRYLVE